MRRIFTIIDELLTKKMSGEELDEGPRISALDDYIEAEFERLESLNLNQIESKPNIEGLNQFFRSILE